jgi:hypothetical protein
MRPAPRSKAIRHQQSEQRSASHIRADLVQADVQVDVWVDLHVTRRIEVCRPLSPKRIGSITQEEYWATNAALGRAIVAGPDRRRSV